MGFAGIFWYGEVMLMAALFSDDAGEMVLLSYGVS